MSIDRGDDVEDVAVSLDVSTFLFGTYKVAPRNISFKKSPQHQWNKSKYKQCKPEPVSPWNSIVSSRSPFNINYLNINYYYAVLELLQMGL